MIGSNITVTDKVSGDILVKNKTCIAIIGQGSILTDEQILQYYFNGDKAKMDNSPHIRSMRRVHKTSKIVFENSVVPLVERYHLDINWE